MRRCEQRLVLRLRRQFGQCAEVLSIGGLDGLVTEAALDVGQALVALLVASTLKLKAPDFRPAACR
jgi:hypothetical protein